MSIANIQAELSSKALLEAVNKMSLKELDRLIPQILSLHAKRKAPHVSKSESELLTKINKGLSAEMKTRLDRLVARRQAETLTKEEQQELIELMCKVEAAQVKRLEALTELARMRGTSLDDLMDQLGIKAPGYV